MSLPCMITATMPMVKQCPYVDEIDVGTVTFTWAGDAPDLHNVAANVQSWAAQKATHEEATRALADTWGAQVETAWRTGGMDVTCASGGKDGIPRHRIGTARA